MKLHITKKQLLKGGGIVLLFVVAGVAGVVASQLLNKAAEPKTVSGLQQQVDETQNLRLTGKIEDANKKADEIISQPGTTDEVKYMLYMQKGHGSMDSKDYKAAVGFYTQAAGVKATTEIYVLIGEANYMQGDKDAAKAAYEKALTVLDPASPFSESDKVNLQQRIDILNGKEVVQ